MGFITVIALIILSTQSIHFSNHKLSLHYAQTNCTSPFVYNTTLQKCVCPSNQVFNETDKSCYCPKDLPYYNGTQCINCKTNEYFNT